MQKYCTPLSKNMDCAAASVTDPDPIGCATKFIATASLIVYIRIKECNVIAMFESTDHRTVGQGRSLLLIDAEDAVSGSTTAGLRQLGFVVTCVETAEEALSYLRGSSPDFVVLDIKLPDANGLSLLPDIRDFARKAHIVIWTRNGSLETAVAAAKAGVRDYLVKTHDINDLVLGLLPERLNATWADEAPLSPNEVRWQHIHAVFEACNGNMSETARQVGMHRRTLQRIMKRGL